MRAGKALPAQGGFTYIGVLFLIVLLGLGLAGTGEVWSLASRRAREKQLLWVGNQYARAIKAYYLQSPGTRQFPAQLEDLVEDRRFPEPRRHLRQLYVDPISRERFDAVMSDDGSRIAGVRSHSDETPMKQDNFPPKYRDFKGSTHYSDWLFVAENLPGSPRRAQAAGADTGIGTATGTAPAASSGTVATPDAPATANPVTANPGTPGSASPTTTPAPAAAPKAPAVPVPRRGPVFSSAPS